MSRSFKDINERLDYIEFRQDLLFDNSELCRLIYESEITEDELKMAEDNIQKITDKNIDEIDKLTDGKEKEIMTV